MPTISGHCLDYTVSKSYNRAMSYIPTGYGNITINNPITAATSYTPLWTTSATMPNAMSVGQSGRVELKGADADITINGVSLSATLKLIQDRLGLLVPNPELEGQFDELRALSEQYRKLEAECREKMRVWNTLRDKTF
jgi:hypothetical protein